MGGGARGTGAWFRGWASPLPPWPNLSRGTPARGIAAGVYSPASIDAMPGVGSRPPGSRKHSRGMIARGAGPGQTRGRKAPGGGRGRARSGRPAGRAPARPAGLGDNAGMTIQLKTPEQIEKMRVAGRLAAEVLQVVAEHVKPGVTTLELDRICHDHIVNVQKAVPANLGYKGYPRTTCISANNVICHGIPSESKVLKDGDI